MTDETAATIVAELRQARKYRHLDDQTLERVARWALERSPTTREATKTAKRKLHQVFGAYTEADDLRSLQARVAGLPASSEIPTFQVACRELLSGHASTKERLPALEKLYPTLWGLTGCPGSVLDLACGYNPFTLPWMGLDSHAEYRAYDIDHRLTAAINDFLRALGRPPTAETRDVLTNPPDQEVDVVLLFKALPCLEQQVRGAGEQLLRRLRCRHMIVSYPLESLGGRLKGMRTSYSERVRYLAASLSYRVQEVEFPSELYFVLAANSPPSA
jgi:16S rRNA (guanine(1405)-N(7))-methyltransferase